MTSVTAPMDLSSLAGNSSDSDSVLTPMACRMIGWMYYATVASNLGDPAHVETQVGLHLHYF